MEKIKNEKYSIGRKLGYASADVLGGGAFALLSLLFLNFLVTVEGMNPVLAGIIVMAGKFWDALVDPMLGIISDRTKSRFGRRRIFLLIGIIPVIVTFSLLWYSFNITGVASKFVYYCFMYILFSTSFSIVQVPFNALLPDMVDSYKQRTGFTTARILISNISATISVTLPALILGPVDKRTPESFLLMSIIFGFLYGLPILITFFTTWENPQAANVENKALTLAQTFKQMALSLKNKTFRQFIGIFIFAQAATDIGTAVSAFWIADILGKPNILTLVSGITMITGILMLPINNHIAKKRGKHCPAYITLPFRIVGLLIAIFLGKDTPLIVIIAISILSGIGAGASSFVPYTLLPDLPGSGEMINGNKNAGLYAGLATFIRTFSSGIAILLTGVGLNLFGYVESKAGVAVTQTSTALFGVKILFTLVPIVLTLVAIFIGKNYRLTKKNHEYMTRAINQKREFNIPTTSPEEIKACEEISGQKFSDMWVGKSD